ncbi:unnamed protein product [Tenebrio molitor]|nr:unnamed protein product [Tenebrio molitor]
MVPLSTSKKLAAVNFGTFFSSKLVNPSNFKSSKIGNVFDTHLKS